MIGVAIENVIIPGLGGIIGGAVAGRFGGKVIREKRTVKKRVFVSSIDYLPKAKKMSAAISCMLAPDIKHCFRSFLTKDSAPQIYTR